MRSVIVTGAALCGLLVPALAAAQSNPNSKYGETNLRKLHGGDAFVREGSKTVVKDRAQVSKVPWVGSWWAYSRDGISHRYGSSSDLSPAEKVDKLASRENKQEREKVDTYHEKIRALNPKATERQSLVLKLNRAIAANRGSSFDWRSTDDGKRYLELTRELETGETEAKGLLTVDTAWEFEKIKHGNGTLGVQGWWGHCNAWSAAAIMDPEPRKNAEVNGLLWRVGDAKALLTEAWMEHNSSFFGSRNEDSEATAETSWKDVTPAAFHIFFADQLGNKDKSFVIDRFTGSEVWNQPVRAYLTKMEPLPKEKKQIEVTKYGSGDPQVDKLSSRDVWPVQVTTSFQWMSDGVPAEELNVETINELDEEEDFGSEWTLRSKYDDQVHVRTVSYVLYLDKPIDDAGAQIIGDGEWKNSGLEADHSHPDFMWQPLSQGPSRRQYENPYVEYDKFVRDVLGKMVVPLGRPSNQATPPSRNTFKADLASAVAIPDNSTKGVSVEIKITGTSDTVEKARLVPVVKHSYRGDLRIYISHKPESGRTKTIRLKKEGDGGSADDWSDTVDLPKFKGRTLAGTWTFKVVDTAAQDVGKIEKFELVFNE